MAQAGDPTDVRSVAVTASDVVATVEARRSTSRQPVLRLIPPSSGRMRARIHVPTPGEYDGTPRPVHVDPESLLDPAAPDYPRPAETEDALRRDPDADYGVERHYDRHATAVADWRAATADAIRERATIDVPSGPHEVAVVVLDGGDETR